jgi:purine-nucleoside phosphorylase
VSDDPGDLVTAAVAAIAERTGVERHDVAVVLGSGWAAAADRLGTAAAEVPMAELPGFAAPSVEGHSKVVRSVPLADGRHLLVLLGRVHAYEGHDLATVVHGVRTAVQAGCGTVVLTNAAGGLRAGMRVGELVLIADHLNLTARSPLTGPDFLDLTEAWSPRLREVARSVDPTLTDGVYAGVPGPHFETPAEIRMLQGLGADLVGMSTVHEVIAARRLGAEVLGLSLVTNLAAGLGDSALDHDEVLDAGRAAAGPLGDLLAAVVARL